MTSEKIASKLSAKLASMGIKAHPEAAFQQKHQQTLGQTTLPAGAPKQAREIAASTPWTGSEQAPDAVLRMLNDAHKPLKTPRERLSTAREHSIDYKYSEGATYKERLKSRTASSGISTQGSIDSIANQQIEDAIARGQFRDLPRGQPLNSQEYKLLNPYIDTTEMILNRMIKKQGAAPPWILKQRAMHQQVAHFRETQTAQIVTMLVHEVHSHKLAIGPGLLDLQCCSDWKRGKRKFHEVSIDQLNSVIRGYNLQAPQSTRKGYLFVDEEVARCFQEALGRVEAALQVYSGQRQVEQVDAVQKWRVQEDASKRYGVREMLREWWSASRREKP